MLSRRELIHNGIKYATELTGGIAIAAGLSRDQGGIERLGETLTPILNPWERAEWALKNGIMLWAASAAQGAVAAEGGMIAVTNETTNQVMVVLGANCQVGAAGATFSMMFLLRTDVAATLTAMGNPTGPSARDNRYPNNTSNANKNIDLIEAWTGSDPTLPLNTTIERVQPPANGMEQFRSGPWVVRPQTALAIQDQTVNQAFQGNMWGYIRTLLPGELV